MRKTLRITNPVKIIALLFFFVSFLCAHNDESVKKTVYPFKERINDLCSGHGLTLLSPEEIQKICDSFIDDFEDVKALQESAATDQYLSRLTGLVILSNLSPDLKKKFLRRSYEISLEPPDGKSEWWRTISRLIEESSILKKEEVLKHTNSDSKHLRAISENYLRNISNKSSEKARENKNDDPIGPASNESDTSKTDFAKQSPDYSNKSVWLLIVGLIFSGTIAFLLIKKRL